MDTASLDSISSVGGQRPLDADLVARTDGGDAAPFETIMRQHNRLLFRCARGIVTGLRHQYQQRAVMQPRSGSLPFLLLLLLLAAGCQAMAPSPTPTTGSSSVAEQPTLLRQTQTALDAAALQSGIPARKLTVLSAQAVFWPDGSLGCPQPGRLYTQALVPGYRVRIGAAGTTLDYHASEHGAMVLCPAGRSTEPVAGRRTIL
ncbi:MAG: hypothetical protein ABIX12_00415 [Rubrivivax sp.]